MQREYVSYKVLHNELVRIGVFSLVQYDSINPIKALQGKQIFQKLILKQT